MRERGNLLADCRVGWLDLFSSNKCVGLYLLGFVGMTRCQETPILAPVWYVCLCLDAPEHTLGLLCVPMICVLFGGMGSKKGICCSRRERERQRHTHTEMGSKTTCWWMLLLDVDVN